MSTSPRMSEEKKVPYTAKTHTVGGREHGVGAVRMGGWTSNSRSLAQRAPAPIRNSCLLWAGQAASKSP
jgi:hypothetical protein